MNPKASVASVLNGLLGLAVVAGLGYGFYRLVMAVIASAATVSSDTSKAIVTAGATVFASVASLVLGKIWEQRTKIKEEVRQRKIPVYEDMIRLLFSFLMAPKDAPPPSDDQISAAFRTITEKILVWGGPEVIREWAAFRTGLVSPSNPVAGFIVFERFVKAMRKELGNSNAPLAQGDLLKTFINDFDAANVAALVAGGGITPDEPRSSP